MANPQQPQPAEPKAEITSNIGVNRQIVQRVETNVDELYILTSANKVRVVLNEAMQCMELRDSWKTPLSILITLVVVFPTVGSFQDFLVSKDTWKAVFIISAILSLVYLAKSLVRRRKAPSVEEIINKLRNQPAD